MIRLDSSDEIFDGYKEIKRIFKKELMYMSETPIVKGFGTYPYR